MRGEPWTQAETAQLFADWEETKDLEECRRRQTRRSPKAVSSKLTRHELLPPIGSGGALKRRNALRRQRLDSMREQIRECYARTGNKDVVRRELRVGLSEISRVCRDLIDANKKKADPIRKKLAAAYQRDNPGVLSIKEQWSLIHRLIDLVLGGRGGEVSAKQVAEKLKTNYDEGQRVAARLRHLPPRHAGSVEASARRLGFGRPPAVEGAVPPLPEPPVEGTGGLVR